MPLWVLSRGVRKNESRHVVEKRFESFMVVLFKPSRIIANCEWFCKVVSKYSYRKNYCILMVLD
jgi:hypothetical protein